MSHHKPSVVVVDHNALLAEDRGIYRELREAHGFDITLIVPRDWREQFGNVEAQPEPSSLRVIPLAVCFRGKSHRVVYRGLASTLHELRPDILWVNSEPEGFAAFQAALLCSMRSAAPRLIFETWRNIPYGMPGIPFPVRWSWLCRLMESYVLPRSVHGVTHSPGGSAAYHHRGFDRISEIPPWVDQSIFFPVSRSGVQPRESPQRFTVGFIGRFVPEKGILLLLDAMRGLGVAADVLLLGDGPQRGVLESHASGPEEALRVSVLPPQPHPGVADLIRRCDVVVLPSIERPGWSEQFGRVIIEAMACGVPVIGSSSGAIPKVIGDAGVVFPSGNAVELAAAILRLYESPQERAKLSATGLGRVAAGYSVAIVARKYADLFEKLVSLP
jgi:glycosyltransferase involved in cell wall biosynthesis